MTAPVDTGPLREALEPFAAYSRNARSMPDNFVISAGSNMARRQLTIGDCRAAESALASEPVAGTVREARDAMAVCPYWNGEKSLSAPPAPAGREDLKDDVLSVLYTYRDHQPEEDESWESWYFAAFDLACMAVRDVFKRHGSTVPPQTRGAGEPLQCLRCGTVDAFGPVSAEKK